MKAAEVEELYRFFNSFVVFEEFVLVFVKKSIFILDKLLY